MRRVLLAGPAPTVPLVEHHRTDTLCPVNPLQPLQSVRSLLPCLDAKRASTVVRDGVYVGIGFAVLGFQRAQVLRREISQQLGRRVR